MIIKLSECGFPRRRLWVTLKHVVSSLTQLMQTLATHGEILAPCEKCGRSEAFEGLFERKGKCRTYQCLSCGSRIQVEMDLGEFGL